MNKIFDKNSFDAEDFVDEVILVQFGTGIYFTLKDSATGIFRLFENPVELEQISEIILKEGGEAKLLAAKQFIDHLITEKILIDTTDAAIVVSEIAADVLAGPYTCERYGDISNLIKLDPIHDVSNLGWPHKK